MEDLLRNEDEIMTNLKAQIYLTAYFIPVFSKKKTESAIINVSSGLGYALLRGFRFTRLPKLRFIRSPFP